MKPFTRIPSWQKLGEAFDLTRAEAKELRGVLDGSKDPLVVSPATAAWERQCYHRPDARELALSAANEILRTRGVEAIWSDDDTGPPTFEYLNAGDTYATTLVVVDGRIVISTYGDEIERLERLGIRFP